MAGLQHLLSSMVAYKITKYHLRGIKRSFFSYCMKKLDKLPVMFNNAMPKFEKTVLDFNATTIQT